MEMPDVQVLVESVANKQQKNKRKRDPDMCLDAVLECTVRKLNRERMEREETLRKRRRIDERTYTCTTASDTSLSGKSSPEYTRTLHNETMLNSDIKTDCDTDTNFANFEDELSGDLKELLDELSREFPCDFWLADANNNNTTVESKDNEGDVWLSSFVELLCST